MLHERKRLAAKELYVAINGALPHSEELDVLSRGDSDTMVDCPPRLVRVDPRLASTLGLLDVVTVFEQLRDIVDGVPQGPQ